MFKRVLPGTIDNSYSGHKLGIWLMALIIVMKLGMGFPSMFIGSVTAQNAHKLNLDAFAPEASQILVLLLARSGLSTVVLALFCLLVLIRYRAMIPVTYVLILVEHAGRAFLLLKESAITGTSSASIVSYALLFFTVVGLAAALYGSSRRENAS